jgi:uncharacterized protein (TIGR00369 family)
MWDKATLKQLLEEFIPFNKFLGVRAREISDEGITLELPFREEFVGDPIRPALHGGVMSTLADVTGGIAVWSKLEDVHARVSTIDMRIDYLRPGKLEVICAEGRVVRLGNRVGVTDMRLYHPSAPAQSIATGKGVYNITVVKGRGGGGA